MTDPTVDAETRLQIDAARLWRSLMDLARIGETPLGGVRRITLTDLDRQGRDKVVEWFRAAGLEVRVDAIGNIFGRRAGRDPSRPPVVAGSHIDSQPSGGKFDGAYGVLAGLEVVRTLNDRSVRTEAPIDQVLDTRYADTANKIVGPFKLENTADTKPGCGK